MAQSVLTGLETHPAAPPAATAPATTTTEATTLVLPTKPISFVRLQVIDALAKLGASALLLYLIQQVVARGLRGFGLAANQVLPGLALGLLAALLLTPWMLLVNVLTAAVSQEIRHGPPPVHPILETLGQHPPLSAQAVLIISALVIAPFAEELFFRGLIQTALLRLGRRQPMGQAFPINPDDPSRHSTVPAAPLLPASWRWKVILLSSLIFAAVHVTGANFEVLPPLLLLAITLGYLYERTGNLWASMTLHLLFNAISTWSFLRFGGT